MMADKPRIIGSIRDYADNQCPICGAEISVTCRCLRGDSTCAAGHHFYRCLKHEVFVEGESDHSRPTIECSCGKDKIDKIVDKHLSPLHEYTDEELREELSRREHPAPIGEFYDPKRGSQTQRIRDACVQHLHDIRNGSSREDADHILYEILMVEVFGDGIWEWLRDRS
jgi:hypothetical protein